MASRDPTQIGLASYAEYIGPQQYLAKKGLTANPDKVLNRKREEAVLQPWEPAEGISRAAELRGRLYDVARNVARRTDVQATAGSAVAGFVILGGTGAVAGTTVGAVTGAAIGVVPAVFTFGLSIPVFGAIGGGVGSAVGTTTGAGAGLVVGGATGYGGYQVCQYVKASDPIEEKPLQKPVSTCRMYDGFTEHAYRLLFAFEERFNCKPELKTILPCGTIENEKILEPEEERALTCFAYAQDIPRDAAQQFLETPFVWERENGTFGLVQTWPVRFNRKFKKDFTYVKYPQNPDEAHFAPQAMEEFKRTVVNMFGEHEDPPLYFCHKQTQNSKSVYVGRGSALLDVLRTNDVIRKELDIVDILKDGFKSRWVNGKQEEGEKEFHMALHEEYALYTKQGWETMACVKLWHQFESEVTLGQQVEFASVAKARTRCAAEAAF